MPSLNLGIIGKNGHAARLINILEKRDDTSVEKIFLHRKDTDSRVTQNIEDLYPCDGIIVSSPTQFHGSQLNLLRNYKGHVFCEKPISLESTILNDLNDGLFLNKFFVNYCFLYSTIGKEINELIAGRSLGELLNATIHFGHGGAYKFNENDWRFSAVGNITPTVLSHFIAFFYSIIPDIKFSSLKEMSITGKGVDTSSVQFENSRATGSIVCSWASPLVSNIQFWFSKAYLQWNGEQFKIYKLPDNHCSIERTSDSELVSSKNITVAENYISSLENALNEFITGIKVNQQNEDQRSHALNTEKLLINNYQS
jgi:predicted dehydrogenase